MVRSEKSDPRATIILIANNVIDKINDDAARYAGRRERGGIFVGLRRGPHIEVKEATLPMKWDLGTMFSFRRSSRGHQEIALKRWQESSQTMDWVGEWHSHPQSIPTPSSIDFGSWRQIITERNAAMVFLIVGYKAQWIGLSIPDQPKPITFIEVERSMAGVAYKRADPF